MTENITFRSLILSDCSQLHEWLQLSHVREFWDDGNRTIEQVKSYYFRDNDTKKYLFSIDNIPAGYIQSYFSIF